MVSAKFMHLNGEVSYCNFYVLLPSNVYTNIIMQYPLER